MYTSACSFHILIILLAGFACREQADKVDSELIAIGTADKLLKVCNTSCLNHLKIFINICHTE